MSGNTDGITTRRSDSLANRLGNVAPRGIEETYGIIANYLYDPKTIEANHEAFVHDGMVVCSPEVNALIVPAAPPVGIAADGA